MSNKIIIGIVIVLVVLGVGFSMFKKSASNNDLNSGSTFSNTQVTEEKQAPEEADIKLVDNKDKKFMKAVMETNKGTIEIEFSTATPKTVENFIKLAKEGFYDGVKFHRVIKGFMVQGGDPLTKDDSQAAMWGTGGPGYKFADEITSTNKNDVGTISMANSGPNTNGSQFFINVNANNFLDTKHTVFGKVVKGMDVVTAIENTKTGAGDRPVEAVVIKGITLE
ncbi:MAG: peptidylprolyl isomerase [Candidatus Paceibacterota bacterium]